MRGLHALEQEFNALKSRGLPIPPELEEALKLYKLQAEELEREFLTQEKNEHQNRIKQRAQLERR